uniref:Uncharacterized protein n=1 Tax=Ananas comosus var. bracteatus TaxID=296719 RepID=A0A6V7PDG0_ANACO|nr:unnamed protein product [Ananas comosus var. bracteatus]
MDSPATPKTPRSRPRSHRKPLQPKNLNSIPQPETLPKPKPIFAGVDAGKENRREASLAEELEAARRRRERLRAERERTEEALTARDATMAAAIRAMERRAEEQRRLESELRRLIGLAELRSSCMSIFTESAWPELVGKHVTEAMATIQRENPQVNYFVRNVYPAAPLPLIDFCCNRVLLMIIIDQATQEEYIFRTPTVG